jgi:Chaperone of endosialidase
MKISDPIRMIRAGICALTLLSGLVMPLPAQQVPGNESIDVVPPMVKFAGVLMDDSGKPPTGTVGVTFSLYRDQQGGAPLWMEIQNAQPDKFGRYSVMLGSASAHGLPVDLFRSGEPRWVGVQLQGQAEQARVMLVSVPYSLKSRDSETVGGLPPSAFLLAAPPSSTRSGAVGASASGYALVPGTTPVTTAGGTVNHLAKFDAGADIKNSIISDNGTNVGIGTTSPAAKLGVNGNVSAAGFNIGNNLFAFGSAANGNAFLGFAGNSTMTGRFNTAVGESALSVNTNGESNSAIGLNALIHNTSGTDNEASGVDALLSNTSGGGNVADGAFALIGNTTGYDNTAVGYNAGESAGDQLTTGSDNTFLGAQTTTGTHLNLSNSTAVGALAEVDQNDSMVLGSINGVNGATASVNVGIGITRPAASLHIGSANSTGLRIEGPNTAGTGIFAASLGGYGAFNIDAVGIVGGRFSVKENGQVTIGPTTPVRILTVAGGFGHPIADGWDSWSSRRWKTNIQTLHGALVKIEQLRGVSYDMRDSGKHQIGVIAEEVGAVVPEVVTWEKNGKDAQGVDYGRLTALLIEATKEQQQLIRQQQEQIRAQTAQLKVQQVQIRAQGTQLKVQQTRIGELSRQVRQVQTTLALDHGTGSVVRTAKASVPATLR